MAFNLTIDEPENTAASSRTSSEHFERRSSVGQRAKWLTDWLPNWLTDSISFHSLPFVSLRFDLLQLSMKHFSMNMQNILESLKSNCKMKKRDEGEGKRWANVNEMSYDMELVFLFDFLPSVHCVPAQLIHLWNMNSTFLPLLQFVSWVLILNCCNCTCPIGSIFVRYQTSVE